MDITFSIITPTILRPSLKGTCDSIDGQSYEFYEHIVIVDGAEQDVSEAGRVLLDSVRGNPRRRILFAGRKYKDFGNTPRNIASKEATGLYLLYLDDDDYHVNDTLASLVPEIVKHGLPDMGVFRCRRKGREFSHFPPRLGRTTSCQWVHKRIIGEHDVLWPTHDSSYLSDGLFLEQVKKLTDPVFLRTDQVLVHQDQANFGKCEVGKAGVR